jgi:hypothetical protein
MSEKFTGSHLNDEELEKQMIALYDLNASKMEGAHKRFVDFLCHVRDEAYSIGYRHGYKDKITGH